MARTYSIPDNFIEGGKLFSGTVKTRNFIEGVIYGGILALIALQIPVSTINTRISLVLFMAAPGFLLGMFGVNGDPFSVFIRNVYQWRKNRKVMLFNGTAQARKDDIVDKMLAQETPQEILMKNLRSMKEKRESTEETYIEGQDFVFEEDEELTKYADSSDSAKSSIFSRLKKQKSDDDGMVEMTSLFDNADD